MVLGFFSDHNHPAMDETLSAHRLARVAAVPGRGLSRPAYARYVAALGEAMDRAQPPSTLHRARERWPSAHSGSGRGRNSSSPTDDGSTPPAAAPAAAAAAEATPLAGDSQIRLAVETKLGSPEQAELQVGEQAAQTLQRGVAVCC